MIGIGLGFVKGGGAAAAEPWYSAVTNLETSNGSATVTADTLAHTKGAWTEIIASNGAATNLILLEATGVAASATDTATLVDIATGASGSETPILENIAIGGAAGLYAALPVEVVSGARLSARIQSVVTGGKTATIELTTYSFGGSAPGTVDILGTSTVTSEGTLISSSWTEVVASTSHAYAAIGVVPSVSTTSAGNATTVVEVGYGPSGSEVAVHKLNASRFASEAASVNFNTTLLSGVTIPSGSRLVAQSTVGFDVTIIGVRA